MSDNPFSRRAAHAPKVYGDNDVEKFAQALRAHNCRQNHILEPWLDIEERFREMWREKARWIIYYVEGL